MLSVSSSYPKVSCRKWLLLSYLQSLLLTHVVFLASALTPPVLADTNKLQSKMEMTSKPSSIVSDTFTIDNDVQEFHQYAASAVDLTMVHATETDVLSVIRSCRNWDADQRQSYLYRFNLKGEDNNPADYMPPVPLDSSVKIYLPSPSGNKTAIIKEIVSKANGDECNKAKGTIVEVWHGLSLLRRIPINEKQHGKIIQDATGFGSPVWSPDETCLLYSAERIPPKTEPFWTVSVEKSGKDATENAPIRGGNNILGLGQRDHWGERYHTQEPILDLYIMNLESGRAARIQNVPSKYPSAAATDETPSVEQEINNESITLGQAVWHPAGDKVAFTAWDAGLPKRLGMIYCRNRASKIFEAPVQTLLNQLAAESDDGSRDEDFDCHSNDLAYARSPRYAQMEGEDTRLMFLGSDQAFASHDACMGLYGVSASGNVDCIVPVMKKPQIDGPKVFGMGFPGLFLSQLPVTCSVGKDHIVTTSIFGSVQRILRVNCSNGNVDLLSFPQLDETTSQTLCCLAPNGDMIVAATSCTAPTSLWLVASKSLQKESPDRKVIVDARKVATFGPVAASVHSEIAATFVPPFKMKIFALDPPEIEGATAEQIQAILLLPDEASSSKPKPLIVVPHGGPHSCTTSSFAPGFAHLASKYAVLFPNYRGSIGFGQDAADSLLTRIGHVDVQDVMVFTRHAIETFSEIDGNKVGICGGSHGGFLTAHCTSQFPDFFNAGTRGDTICMFPSILTFSSSHHSIHNVAACRNPVTNIASMLTSTDIPDWCFAEAFGQYNQEEFQGPTKDQILTMYEKSPVSRVRQVKTPTLVALGQVDLRVPYSQGLEWYYSLRSNRVPTKLLLYPKDCHALDRDTTEADHWIHIRQWMDEYLS
jgi:acylaminoacyl-peptidase